MTTGRQEVRGILANLNYRLPPSTSIALRRRERWLRLTQARSSRPADDKSENSLEAIRQWPEVYDLCHTFFARFSRAILAWPCVV